VINNGHKKYLAKLSKETREYIRGIVKSTCIEKGVKGGLYWPLEENVETTLEGND